MRLHFVIALILLTLPVTVFAKTEKDCRGQGNRIFYARCMNEELTKRPIVHVIPHKMAETPCLGKTGKEQADCMKVQTRIRRDARRELDGLCNQLDGMAKRLCDANGAPTGTGAVLRAPINRVVPLWKSTRKKYTKLERIK